MRLWENGVERDWDGLRTGEREVSSGLEIRRWRRRCKASQLHKVHKKYEVATHLRFGLFAGHLPTSYSPCVLFLSPCPA